MELLGGRYNGIARGGGRYNGIAGGRYNGIAGGRYNKEAINIYLDQLA